VWCELIGEEAALSHLRFKHGVFCDGYSEKNKTSIDHHFRPNTLSLDVARALHAPLEEVDPKQIPENIDDLVVVGDEDDDDDIDDQDDTSNAEEKTRNDDDAVLDLGQPMDEDGNDSEA
jgi:hypothetical protein